MEKPYLLEPGKLMEGLREVFKRHGWSASDAYDLANEIVRQILRSK